MTAPAPTLVRDAARLVDAELDRRLALPPGTEDPGRLRESMRYAVLRGGKRIRPAVVMGAAAALGGTAQAALPAAAAIELLHAYTLVHDDMPCMDDDDFRRGEPTVHVVFGQAIALLCGDALLTEAFLALAELPEPGPAVVVLGRRAGAQELLAGQARDLSGTLPQDLPSVERLHREKTGALFSAAAELGALAAGGSSADRERLASFGMALGVAFQHADDLADGDFPGLAAEARRRLDELVMDAIGLLAPYGTRGTPLLEVAEWVRLTGRSGAA